MFPRRRKIILSIAATVLLLGVAGYFHISSESFLNNFIKPRLIKALNDQIDDKYEVHLGRFHGNIFSGVKVEDFSIYGKNAEGQSIISTDNIVLKYNIWGLLQRKLLVNALEIHTPIIDLRRNSNGQFNFSQVFSTEMTESTESGVSFAFAVSNVNIINGEIHYSDSEKNIDLRLPDISIELTGTLEQWDHSGRLSIGEGSFSVNQSEFLIKKIDDINFSVSTHQGNLGRLKLQSGGSEIDFQKVTFDWDKGDWNILVKLTLDAEEIQKLLDENLKIEGSGELIVDLHGTPSTINGKINGFSDGFSINRISQSTPDSEIQTSGIEITSLSIDSDLDLDVLPQLRINLIKAEIAEGIITGSGSATLDNTSEKTLIKRLQHYTKNPISYDSNWQIEDVKMTSLLDKFALLPQDSPRIESGIFAGSIQMKGDTTGNYLLDSKVHLSDASLFVNRNAGETIAIQDSLLNFLMSSDTVNGSSVNVDGNIDSIEVNMEGSLDDLDLQLSNVDFGKLFRIANTISIEGIGNVSAKIRDNGTVTGFAEIPKTFFSHRTDNPILMGRLMGNFRYEDKTVYFENGRLTHSSEKGESKINIDGNIKIADNLPANFNILIDPLILDTNYNKLLFLKDYPIEGNLKGELKLSGFLVDRLDGTCQLTYDSGKVWGINLDPATLYMEIDDYSLSIPHFAMTTRDQLVILKLHIANTGDFELTIQNEKDKPIQLAEIGIASDMTDFPLDGKMNFNLVTILKSPNDIVLTTDFIFSELTFDGNPLGDANLYGLLMEKENLFKFTGKALSDTAVIEGIIENEFPNHYNFKIVNNKTTANYILPIINPALKSITGTFNGTVEIEGTVNDLISDDTEIPSMKRVHPYDVDIIVNETKLQIDDFHFTNPTPLLIKLEDDLLTFTDFALSVEGEVYPFIQISGDLNAKTEVIKLSSETNQVIELESIFNPLGLPITGTVYYDMEYKGTISKPIIEVNWKIPNALIKTDRGEIVINDANSSLIFQDGRLVIEPFFMEVLDNTTHVEGNIVINQNEFNNSLLQLNIKSDEFDLKSLTELFERSISAKMYEYLSSQQSDLIKGKIYAGLDVKGTISEPILEINTHTIENHLIGFSAFSNPISIQKLHALMSLRKGTVQVDDFVLNGTIDRGEFHVFGVTSFPTKQSGETKFDIGVNFEQMVLDDFFSLYMGKVSPLKGTVSGTVKFTGTGFTSNQITSTTNLRSITINLGNFQIKNSSEINFGLKDNNINTVLPLQVKSPDLELTVTVTGNGPLVDPHFSLNWKGILTTSLQKNLDIPLHLDGKLDYLNKLITLNSQITNNEDKLILKGGVPFNLSLSKIEMYERFIDSSMHVQLIGNELPLTFIPGINSVLSESAGVVDLDISINGTTRSPYFEGKIFIESPAIQVTGLHHSFDNVSVQITASQDLIEFNKFQFDIEDGTCRLDNSQLLLDGLTPKEYLINGLSVKQYPIDTVLSESLPKSIFEDLNGHVSTTLKQLRIPFDSFFENAQITPIPKLKEVITFDRMSQKATAEISIDDISLDFIALDKHFHFKNPTPIPISLDSGTFVVKELKLVDTIETNSVDTTKPIEFTSFGRWNRHGEMYANLLLDNFNISSLHQTLSDEFRERYNLQGFLSTEINVRGVYASPEIAVKIGGRNLRINQADIDEFIGTFQYIDSEQQWNIYESEPVRIKLGDNRVICYGNIPFLLSFSNMQAQMLPEQVEVKVNVELEDLGILRDIEDNIQSTNGQGTINATITGTPDSLMLKGSGDFNEISLSFTDSPIALSNIDAAFDFTHKEITIEHIDGMLNEGIFSVHGKITSDWLTFDEIDLKAQLNKCNFVQPGSYQIILSSDNLHLYGEVSTPVLDGDIKIVSGLYEQNWNWADLLDSFASPTVSETDIISDAPILRNLTLNLGITILDSFHLLSSTGGSTNIEVGCNGKLTGAIQLPIFSGTVTIPKGIISIYTQVFEIDESVSSTITNQSDRSFNPELNIHLKVPNPIRNVLHRDGSTADYNIVASVTGILENGNPDQAVLTLRADPINSSTTEVLAEADILALLLPGNTFSRSLGGITFTISSGFDPNERHITAEIPLTLLGRSIPITVEGNEKKGEFGVDFQLLQGRY